MSADELTAKAKSLRELKNYAEALKQCTRMIQLRPGEPGGYAIRAKVYQEMGRPDLAKKDLEQTNKKSDFPF